MDGASGPEKQGVGLVIKGPEGLEVPKSVKFSFPVTSNVAEYKALISGLELARKVDVWMLNAYSDSNLLVQQMNGEYDIRDPMLKKYMNIVKELAWIFEQLEIEKIPQSLNSEADLLSKADNPMKKERNPECRRVVLTSQLF